MDNVLSQADLDYCIRKGIISKSDSIFYKRYDPGDDKESRYKQIYDTLNGTLKHYSGIANKVLAMRERTIRQSAIMRAAINAMHKQYAEKQVETNSVNH